MLKMCQNLNPPPRRLRRLSPLLDLATLTTLWNRYRTAAVVFDH